MHQVIQPSQVLNHIADIKLKTDTLQLAMAQICTTSRDERKQAKSPDMTG